MSQEVCPLNIKFAQTLKIPEFAREFLVGKNARTLARDILAMTQEEFIVAFKGSPMKRAKPRGLKRNAAVVLGNLGTGRDAEALTRVLDDSEPVAREHAAWTLAQIDASEGAGEAR